jgi:hypothetical protein
VAAFSAGVVPRQISGAWAERLAKGRAPVLTKK